MNKKLLLTSALASGLAFAGSSFAQTYTAPQAGTTVSGNLFLNYYGVKYNSDNTTSKSYNGWGRESQLNIANSGTLNNGLKYSVGFSLEFDGNTDNTSVNGTTGTEPSTISNENVFIDIIFPTNTTLTFGVDHIQHSQTTITPSASVNIADASDTRYTTYTNAVGANPKESIGLGLMQKTPFGTFSGWYAPNNTDTGGRDTRINQDKQGRNSAYEIGFVGDLGVKGLTVKAFDNKEKKPTTVDTATVSISDIEGRSYGVAYNFGDITVGGDKTYSTSSTAVKVTGTTYGAAYAVNKEISLSVVKAIAEKENSALAVDEKIMQYAVGYNLGAISVGLDYTTIKNSTNLASVGDVKVGGLKLATKF